MSLDPIRVDLRVAVPPADAFAAFTAIGRWWDPRYTADASAFRDVLVEPRVGGAVAEVHADGTTLPWGAVSAWAPGERFAFASTLAQTREHPSEVAVVFEAADGGGTRVAFEHGGWHEGNASDRGRFSDWPQLLARFRAYAEGGEG